MVVPNFSNKIYISMYHVINDLFTAPALVPGDESLTEVECWDLFCKVIMSELIFYITSPCVYVIYFTYSSVFRLYYNLCLYPETRFRFTCRFLQSGFYWLIYNSTVSVNQSTSSIDLWC